MKITLQNNTVKSKGRFLQKLGIASKIYEQQGDTLRALENDEKFLDLPRWITLSTEQNLFDIAILRGLWKNANTDLPDLIDAKTRYARLKEFTNK